VRDACRAVVHFGIGALRVLVGVGVASNFRTRGRDTSWVKSDQVEPLPDLCGQPVDEVRRRVDTGLTRPAGVDDQGADLLSGGWKPDQGQVDDGPVGFGVVDGDRELAALRVCRQFRAAPAAPAAEPTIGSNLPRPRFAETVQLVNEMN
jgi:hypothetical protein